MGEGKEGCVSGGASSSSVVTPDIAFLVKVCVSNDIGGCMCVLYGIEGSLGVL